MNTRVLIASFAISVAAGPLAAAPSPASQPAASQATLQGKAVESMKVAGYTYVLIDDGKTKSWAAVPEVQISPGDQVAVSEAMKMTNYHSKTLNRTFDSIYFSGSVSVNGKRASAATSNGIAQSGSASSTGAGRPASVDLSNIARAANGKTVAEVYAGGSALAGKPVTVRGRVVKFNGGIMGRNWLHVRDGSGSEGTNDLTVTSKNAAKVGDLVVITGVLAANRDFGGGYKYPLIVEDATVTVE